MFLPYPAESATSRIDAGVGVNRALGAVIVEDERKRTAECADTAEPYDNDVLR